MQENYSEAEKAYKLALELSPHHETYTQRYAEVLVNLKRHDEAKDLYFELYNNGQNGLEVTVGLVRCLFELNQEPMASKIISFLTESRKAQFVKLLSRAGNLPLYYVGDEEVYLKYAKDADGCGYAFLFNIGTDPIDKIVLKSETAVKKILALTPDGKWKEVEFSAENGRLALDVPAYTLMPVALKLI